MRDGMIEIGIYVCILVYWNNLYPHSKTNYEKFERKNGDEETLPEKVEMGIPCSDVAATLSRLVTVIQPKSSTITATFMN
jgi:hypothetical protein